MMNNVLQQLMTEKGLTEETIFYRYTFPEFLTDTGRNTFMTRYYQYSTTTNGWPNGCSF